MAPQPPHPHPPPPAGLPPAASLPPPPPPPPPAGPRALRTPPRRGPGRSAGKAIGVLLAVGAAGIAFVMLIGVAATVFVVRAANRDRSNVGRVELTHPLHIPPVLEGRDDGTGTKVYGLRFTAGTTELKPGTRTDTWGLNGTYLGPTLRAARGDRVRIDVTNDAGEDTTLHWHGMHLPAVMDGGPHQLIEPGDTWSPTWTVDQPAATLWYHPHLHGRTADHVLKGAAGLFLLDDAEMPPGLPSTYGVDDVPVVIQDRSFGDDGELTSGGFLTANGQIGDEILVNGTWGPVFEATTTRVRLRLLNGSNTRVYNLGFTDDRDYSVIATDSGLLPAPVTVDRLDLAPGERAEIVVDVRPGDDVVLRSFPFDMGGGFLVDGSAGAKDTMDVLRLRAAPDLEPRPQLPARLVEPEPVTAPADATVRRFRFSGTSINGQSFDMTRVDAAATVDTDEVWEVEATDQGLHVFHLHDVRFRILDINGSPPPAVLDGWKDTVRLHPGRRFRLLVRFEDYADAEHAYMFHCHILQHEDQGMMGQVVVLPPGAEPPDSLPDPHAGHGAGGGARRGRR